MGAAFDFTCVSWSHTCAGKSNCVLYNGSRMRKAMLIICVVPASIMSLILLLAWFLYRFEDRKKHEAEMNQSNALIDTNKSNEADFSESIVANLDDLVLLR